MLAGTYAAGAALLCRDLVQRAALAVTGSRTWAIAISLAAIAVAGALSWIMATPGLAVASVTAFTVAELVDLAVFTPLEGRAGLIPAIAGSNIVSAPVDTLLFLAIAGFPITGQLVAGQLVGKLLWATAVPLALLMVAERLIDRRPAAA